MEGGDGGRQQVVVMHRATFLATLIDKRDQEIHVPLLHKLCVGDERNGWSKNIRELRRCRLLSSKSYCTCLPLCMSKCFQVCMIASL